MKSILLILVIAIGALAGVFSQFYLTSVSQPALPDAGGQPMAIAPEQIAANGVVEGRIRSRPCVWRLPAPLPLSMFARVRQCSAARCCWNWPTILRNIRRPWRVLSWPSRARNWSALRNGERTEKRKAAAAVEAARAPCSSRPRPTTNARIAWFTPTPPASSNSRTISFKLLRAKAELAEAAAEHALVEAPARKEDIAAAEGRVAAAEAKLRLAETDLAKTRLLARSSGRILRVHAELGELATPNSVQPLLTMADLSHLRVRAFIEELDAGHVRVGQRAAVTADGYPGQEFPGTVALVIPHGQTRAADRRGQRIQGHLFPRSADRSRFLCRRPAGEPARAGAD